MEFEKKLKSGKDSIFPNDRALKKEIRERFSREVYGDREIVPDKSVKKRYRLVLVCKVAIRLVCMLLREGITIE